MKVSINPEHCYGSHDCVFRAPSVFTTTVDGRGAVIPGREDTGEDPQVVEAADRCPSQAITIGVE